MTSLDIVKKELISILNMYPKGISIDKLKKEYKANIGTQIPYGEFGYQNIIDLLKDDLKENVSVEMIASEWVCIPLGSANTKHMLDIIHNQNPAKIKGRHSANVDYLKM